MPIADYICPMDAYFIDATTIAIDRWDALNGSGMWEPCIWFKILNDSHTDIFVSWNAVDDHFFVPSFTKIAHSLQLNSSPPNYISKAKKGLTLYIRGLPDKGGGGSIVFTGYFNKVIR
jgi:hypothetical protein